MNIIKANKVYKQNIFKRNFKHFDKNNFILDLLDINWEHNLKINQGNVNFSFDALLKTVNNLLDQHAPMQKLSKKDSDLHFKPWLTPGILKSIQIRNKLHKNLIKTKNSTLKETLESSFKNYRNIITTLTKQSKKNYFQIFFTENTNNIKKHGKELITSSN